MLFKLSLKNIKKSFKDYAIYFFTLTLGVAIFYIFNAISTQTVMLNLNKSTSGSLGMITTAISAISVLVSCILGFLVIYANRFLMKRRKKEFGIYMTLGMGKGSISRIILFETVLIGIISLVIGLICGVALSQIMSIVVANLFEVNMNKFKFVISNSAILKTIAYFSIIYILVMIFNVFQVSRCKLIDLIQSDKIVEEVKIKNPYICILVFIISVGLLSFAYYNVTAGATNLVEASDVIMQIVYGIIGTFLFFWSISGLILKIVMCRKNTYYKNLNNFTLRQISSKVNTTVFSMSIISLMLFVTICVFSSSIAMNNDLRKNSQDLAKADISISKYVNLTKISDDGYEFTDNQVIDSKKSINEDLRNENFDVDKNFKEKVEVNTYSLKEVTLGDVINKKVDKDDELYDYYNSPQTFMKISDYNKIAKIYGEKTYSLKNDEFIVLCNYKGMVETYNENLSKDSTFKLNEKTYKLKYKEVENRYITMSTDPSNMGIILVQDSALEKKAPTNEIMVANYNGNSKVDKENIDNKLENIQKRFYDENKNTYFSRKIEIYNSNIGASAMAVFIGLYIGIVFLISSAAILALKELSESTDSKQRYNTLRKIGIDENMINRSLFIQIGVFFAFPLILAIVHSIFGIQVLNMMTESYGRGNILKPIIMTAGFLIVIYGGYFAVTYLCSKNIIKED